MTRPPCTPAQRSTITPTVDPTVTPTRLPTILLTVLAPLIALPAACRHIGDRPAPATATAAATSDKPPGGFAAIPGRPGPRPDARAALQAALAYIERDGVAWMNGRTAVQNGTGCFSCHHVGFALWGHREAQRAGLAIATHRIDALERQAHQFYENISDGEPVALSQLLLGRQQTATAGKPLLEWRAIQNQLVADQQKAGNWKSKGQFPNQNRPIEETDAVWTMWVLLALGSFPDLPPPVRASRDRAYTWLKTRPPGDTNEWLITRLIVERQLGAPAAAETMRRQLLAQQHPDGGWGWRAAEPSNAYSTGQTLYALATAGVAPSDPAIRRGVDYLRVTQNADGTWTTGSKLTSKRTSPRRDYIYQYWGSAWAAIGLARTLAPATPGLATR
jgi:hypothetical protein